MRIKYASKLSCFYVAVICTTTRGVEQIGLVSAVMINQAELAINDKARNSAQLQTLVYGCIIAHPRLERDEGCTIAGRRIIMGAQNPCGGAKNP